MSESISRRDALKKLALVAAAAGIADDGTPLRAAELPHLKTNDPTAVALAYRDDAKQVDPQQFPTYRAGQNCSNCLQLQGTPGQTWRACNLFPGMLVNANGWCRVWVMKS